MRVSSVVRREVPFKGADSVLHANHGFKGILTRREAEIMSYCLNSEEEATADELNRFRGRDSGMYENAKFLMKTMLKKMKRLPYIVIWGM